MKKWIFALVTIAASMLAQAELPSGTVGSLLAKAETGNLPAIYSLTGGLGQVSVDTNNVMNAQINGKRIPAMVVVQLDPASSAFVIGMMYSRHFPETEAVSFYCRWAQRAFALHQQGNTVSDIEAEMKWSNAIETFENMVESLSKSQREDCDAQAKNWRLTGD